MKSKLRLILPNKKYIKSFEKGLNEFRQEGTRQAYTQLQLFKSSSDWHNYIKRMREKRKGINLKRGRVPSTYYWLVKNNKFVGTLNIRHRLNKNLASFGGHIGDAVVPSERRKGYAKEMLRLGLKRAKGLGLDKILITCNPQNIPSKKIIQANGGKLINKLKTKEGPKLRYRIVIK